MTLVSYVPKADKAVILLSTEHHDREVDQNNKQKPQIIIDYNKFKGIK